MYKIKINQTTELPMVFTSFSEATSLKNNELKAVLDCDTENVSASIVDLAQQLMLDPITLVEIFHTENLFTPIFTSSYYTSVGSIEKYIGDRPKMSLSFTGPTIGPTPQVN